MTASSWFQTHPIDDHCWAIDDHGIDVMYLLTGSEHALLIDTGMGIGDLAGLVKTLTDLPVWVVNTHGHVDHVSGNGQFRQVHISTEDLDAIKEPWSDEDRTLMQQHFFSGDNAPETSGRDGSSGWVCRAA